MMSNPMPEENPHPVDPVEITLADGKVRQLRYMNSQIKRIKKAFGLTKFADLFGIDLYDTVSVLIYEGLVEKGDLTPEAIDDLIPAHKMPELQTAVVAALAGKSVDEVKNELGRALEQSEKPTPTTAAATSTGYVNGHSSDSSDSPATSTGALPEQKLLLS